MNKSKLSKFIVFLLIFALFCAPYGIVENQSFAVNDSDLKISSKSAILVDSESGTVVFEKKSNERLPIASMTKLASLSIILGFIEKVL